MSGKALYLTFSVAAASLATVALTWLIVAPWRLERILGELRQGALEPVTLVVFGGPLLLGAAAALMRLRESMRQPARPRGTAARTTAPQP